MQFNKITLAGLVLCGSVLMTACGGDSDTPVQVASNNITATITPTTGAAAVAAVKDQNFQFASGVSSFGTTAATTVKLSGSNTAPAFAINSGANSATGVMTFGSCIFTVTGSNFDTSHALGLGKVLTTPCAVNLQTAGQAVGAGRSIPATLQVGPSISTPLSVTAVIAENGSVTVNGSPVGSVTVVASTGASN